MTRKGIVQLFHKTVAVVDVVDQLFEVIVPVLLIACSQKSPFTTCVFSAASSAFMRSFVGGGGIPLLVDPGELPPKRHPIKAFINLDESKFAYCVPLGEFDLNRM